MTFDWRPLSKVPPYDHQVVGVAELVRDANPATGRIIPGAFFLGDEPGAGKTKQVIDAAQTLHREGKLAAVVTVTISEARPVWYDPDPSFGEIAHHIWADTPAVVLEFHSKVRAWQTPTAAGTPSPLTWYVTNYEYLRAPAALKLLLGVLRRYPAGAVLVVLDEAAAIRNKRSAQFKTCLKLRRAVGRVWLLNGTPIAQHPRDAFAQCLIMHPSILGCPTETDFMARYAVMDPHGFKAGGRWQTDPKTGRKIQVGGHPTTVKEWINLDDLQRRVAPYMLRRLKDDCLDLPAKLPPATETVTLDAATWRIYKDMRAEALAWLDAGAVGLAQHAGAKVMRLAQITSGFLGGVSEVTDCAVCGNTGYVGDGEQLSMFRGEPCECQQPNAVTVKDVGDEKRRFLLDWLARRRDETGRLKVMVWCRFRRELELLRDALASFLPGVKIGCLYGGQHRAERLEVLRLAHPGTSPDGPIVVLAIDGVGATGVNCAALDTVVHLSHGNSLFHRIQGDERVHRPGQTRRVAYHDVVAVGPAGQHTVDHVLVKALRERADLATWVCSAWAARLREEVA